MGFVDLRNCFAVPSVGTLCGRVAVVAVAAAAVAAASRTFPQIWGGSMPLRSRAIASCSSRSASVSFASDSEEI